MKHYKGHNFRNDILNMNAMYNLPTASLPSVRAVYASEQTRVGRPVEDTECLLDAPLPKSVALALARRLLAFKHTLSKELDEADTIVNSLLEQDANDVCTLRSFLVNTVDLFVDLGVYVASERQKFGLHHPIFDSIVMWSNKTKLGADGKPIHDTNGKFLKGPNFQPPEPALSRVIEESFAHLYNQDYALGLEYTPDWKMTPAPESEPEKRSVLHVEVDGDVSEAQLNYLVEAIRNASLDVSNGSVKLTSSDGKETLIPVATANPV